jgi:hypothetical protein
MMGLCVSVAIRPTSAIAQTPSLLGRGHTPYLNQVQQSPVTVPAGLRPSGQTSNSLQFGLVASSQDFERVMQADMSLSVDKVGSGAKIRASLTKEFRSNRRQITFAAGQQIIRGNVSLSTESMRLTRTASRLLESDPAQYLASHGTSLIETVEVGGSAVFLFTFNFASEEEAMRSSLSGSGHYGLVEGSLSVSVRELLKKNSNNVTLSALVTGTTRLPTFFGRANPDSARAAFYTAKYSEEMLQNILAYIDRFSATVDSTPVADLSQVGFVERHLGNVASVKLTPAALRVFRAAEEFGDRLQDQLDLVEERQQALSQMTGLFNRYNTEANIARAASLRVELKAAMDTLLDIREAFEHYLDRDAARLSRVRVPEIPVTFCTTTPADISPRMVRTPDAGNPKNRPSEPPRKWLELVVTPRLPNATYTVWVEANLGHSRTDPGCNWGHLVIRARRSGTSSSQQSLEVGSWQARLDQTPEAGEVTIDDTREFSVCRGQADSGRGTKAYAFTSADVVDVRALYANWDDIGYTSLRMSVFRCGQP